MSTRARTRTSALAAGLLAASFAMPAAGTVIYDEAVDGDLPTFAPFPLLALSAGDNTVVGSVTFSFGGAVAVDFDGFNFSVPAGSSLLSVSMSLSLRPEGSGTFTEVGVALNGASFDTISVPSAGESLFSAALPLGPGVGEFVFTNLTGSLASGEYRTADYAVTFTLREVAEVPAPGALLPMLVGLVGLGLTRWRRA